MKLSERDHMLALPENEEYGKDFAQYGYARTLKTIFASPCINFKKKWDIEIPKSPENIRQTYRDTRDKKLAAAVTIALQRKPGKQHIRSPLQDSRYLFLKVDLMAGRGEILKEAWEHIEQAREYVGVSITKERNRDNHADHWEVYHRCKGGESLVQITKDIFHKVDDPHLDDPHYKSVKRAHKHAKDLIRLIKPLPH